MTMFRLPQGRKGVLILNETLKQSGCFSHSKGLISLAVATAMLSCSGFVAASPWLEAQDPFLRSSLQLLSDSDHLASPVSHYPMRWSMFGDDLNTNPSDDVSVQLAQRELQYGLNSAKLNRGNRVFTSVVGNEAAPVSSFGQFNRDKWGAYASYEHLANHYAFRVTTGYSYNGEDQDIRWENSYLSLNAGNWLFSVGTLDRWWGQGWQHNLILGSYATANPDLGVSYIGESRWLGVWSIESVVSKPDDAELDYHSASRFVSKPLSWFDYGLTYQTWFDVRDESQAQVAADVRFTLPSIELNLINQNSLYHSVYGEFASNSEKNELGAYLIGWTGSLNIQGFTVRTVLESQQSTHHHANDDWQLADSLNARYPSTNMGAVKNTYTLENSWSAAMYLQTPFDHSISLRYQESDAYFQRVKSSEMSYRFPALQVGMVHLGLRYDSEKENRKQQDETTIWTGFEFRF